MMAVSNGQQIKKLILALDVGTLIVRASTYDYKVNVLAFADRQLAFTQLRSSKTKQDPLEIQTAVNELMQAVLTNLDFPVQAFTFAGLARQRSSIVAGNRKIGDPLTPVLNCQDGRAAKYLEPPTGIDNSSEQNASYLLERSVNGAGAAINGTIEQWNEPNLAQWLDEVVSSLIFINTIDIKGSLSNLDGLCQRLANLTHRVLLAASQSIDWLAAKLNQKWNELRDGSQAVDYFCRRTTVPINCIIVNFVQNWVRVSIV